MSVEPRNRLWNRLLARAEARAAKGTAPEPHHYHPVSATDDHLRSSFENSLIYHGLKIETEFNLQLQRPPRKRKTKRKSDLPIAERLRNDRAAAGSPGPTHRTPTGTPTRRISKSTPLSRPPIPLPPSLPPIPVTTRAAAARERVLNAVSDDDGPPTPRNPPVIELSDSSDGILSVARTTKRDSDPVVVLPHFDMAADSNDTSLWEEDAILVGQPSKVEDSADDKKLDQRNIMKALSKKNSAQDFRAPYRTSKEDRARRAKAREAANSDSSLAGDSDLGKSKHAKESRHQEKLVRHSSRDLLESGSSSEMGKTIGCQAQEENLKTSKAQPSASRSGESSTKKNSSSKANPFDNQKTSTRQGSKSSLVSEDLLTRITTFTKKDSCNTTRPIPVLYLNSSSDDEHPGNCRPSPPMRALLPRRRTPPNVSVEDRLFGRLSPLSSPRRRTRSMSNTKKRSSRPDVVSSPDEVHKSPVSQQKGIQGTCESSEATGRKSKRPTNNVHRTPLRKTSRRLDPYLESSERDREEEVIPPSSTNLTATASRKSSSPIDTVQLQKREKHSIQEGSLGDLSDEIFDVDLIAVDVKKIQPLTKTVKRNKSPPSSSLSESTVEVEESNGLQRNSTIRRRVKGHDIPLLVNATIPGQHRVEPKVLEITGNPINANETHGGDSEVCCLSVSPVVKRRRVTRNHRSGKKAGIPRSRKEESPKEFSTKSTSRRSAQSPASNKQENQRDARIDVSRGLPLQTCGSAIAEEHRKISPRSPEGKQVESQQEACHSSAITSQIESKYDSQTGSKMSLPLRIHRSMFTEEGGIACSKTPREKSDDKLQDIFDSSVSNTQQQTKRDVETSCKLEHPPRNRGSGAIQKRQKVCSRPLRGKVWNSLSDRMKGQIQKAVNGEGGYLSDHSFDSDWSGRKRRRKFAVYQDGRIKEITD